MRKSTFGLFLLISGIIGAPTTLCPKECDCLPGIYLEARCKSFDFLKKSLLSPKQLSTITTLEVDNTSFKRFNPDLSHFHNLKYLKMISNKLEYIVPSHFPNSLEHLDLSNNLIKHIPEGLRLLPALKEIDLSGNPMDCACDLLVARDDLLKTGIRLLKPVYCEFPANLHGKLWNSVSCRPQEVEYVLNEMPGDEPFEGSGSGDLDVVTENEVTQKWDASIEDEYMRVGSSSTAQPTTPTTEPITTDETELEGSGDETEMTAIVKSQVTTTPDAFEDEDDDDDDDEDEDYEEASMESTPASEFPAVTVDMSLLNRVRIKACNFNCSTPSPIVQDDNDTDVSPSPNFFEGIRILVNDLGILGNQDETTMETTETFNEVTTTLLPDHFKPVAPVEIEQPIEVNSTDVEIIAGPLDVQAEKDSISEEPTKQSNSTFIFLSVLLLIIICLVIYAIVKKRAMRRNRNERADESIKNAEEMEPLKKAAPEAAKPNGTHETVPFINGHSDTQQKPIEENSSREASETAKPEEVDEVALRQKSVEQKDILTPEAKRVTIKASEIPNSTPKTPILVTRHVNSDGSIITTPNIEQRS